MQLLLGTILAIIALMITAVWVADGPSPSDFDSADTSKIVFVSDF